MRHIQWWAMVSAQLPGQKISMVGGVREEGSNRFSPVVTEASDDPTGSSEAGWALQKDPEWRRKPQSLEPLHHPVTGYSYPWPGG